MLPLSRTIALRLPAVHAADSLVDALQDGKTSFLARARYESVEQDNALKDADAFTVRSVLGFETGDYFRLASQPLDALLNIFVITMDYSAESYAKLC